MIIIQELIIFMEDSKTLVCSPKFLCASELISSKFTDNLGTRPRNSSPDLVQWDQRARVRENCDEQVHEIHSHFLNIA